VRLPEEVSGMPLERLRVMTMNAHGPANPDWDRRHRLLGNTIRELDPDVIALQEVPLDLDADLGRILGHSYHLASFSEAADGVAGTVATRWPHRLIAEVDLRITERATNALSWSAAVLLEMETPLGNVVVVHHKPSWPFPFEHEREQQAVLVARTVEAHIGARDVHAVVLGDFDATPDSASLSFWRGRRPVDGFSVCYQDAWEYAHPGDPGYTFEVTNPLVRDGEVATAVTRKIDHILVRSIRHGPTLQVAHCQRVLDRPVDGVWASDHYGVLADLVLPANPPGFRS
jgi:endonuclease/exonuclease/phosphatase family metal-dependent hydrolase